MPCGFCLRGESACIIFLTNQADPQIDTKKSHCPRLVKFKYRPASESMATSPCSNVPIPCPACPHQAPAIWKYNLKTHLQLAHSEIPLDRYQKHWELSGAELYGMQELWQRIQSSRMTNKKRNPKKKILVSEGHASRIAMG